MKKVIFVIMLAVISISGYAQARQGSSSIGGNIGYAFDTENATIGLDYRYCVTNEFRLAPAITYFTRSGGLSAFSLDLNAHYVVQLDQKFAFYPLAGIGVSFWDWKNRYFDSYYDDYDATRLGLTLGLGGEVYATREISVGMEVKYHILEDFSQPLLAVRVGYNF